MSRLDLRSSLAHAIADGRRRLAASGPGERLVARRRARAIAASPFFDPEWYLAAHDDLVDVDPLTHFLLHGESEGRDPGPDFDTPAYVWCNPGAAGAALTHFVTYSAPGQRPEHVVDLSQPALADRWFDPDWYAARHPDLVSLLGLDLGTRSALAWRHYRRCGGEPGPFFDREDFEIRNGVGATPEPLTAWLRRRDEDIESGRVRVDTSGHRRGPIARPALLARRDLERTRVAVAIHAFHLDLLDELLERVAWVPGRVTVLVTTNEIEAISQIDERITATLGDIARTVRFTPNAGRNFGPLLAGLDHDLREHDVVLHLHTKKSLASGSEQRGWRHDLLDGLLPSPAGVQAIVSALATSDAPELHFVDDISARAARPIGLVHAPTWPGLPTFANHWLGNRGRGEQLFSALGLDPADASGWLDYPVGGMFWIRADALTPLLDLSIQFAEYGEELGQTDRTLAHAVERVIPASTRAAGFDVVELDSTSGQWRHNWSERHLTGVGVFDPSSIDALLDSADVVSVDLFDTLLLRPTTDPDGLFTLLADDLGEHGPELVAARRRAEHLLRTGPDAPGDVGLAEIANAMRDELAVSADEAERLVSAELGLEHRLAIARRWLIERLRQLRADHPDTAVALLTDTTQPPEAVAALLERIGAADVFTHRFVSNQCRARKDSGALWEVLEQATEPTHLVHLGDNPMSDLQQASDRGHRWIQTPAPGELPAMGGVDLRQAGGGRAPRRLATEFLVGHGLAAFAGATSPRLRVGDDLADAYGHGVVGPMMTAFAHWISEAATQHELDVVLFGGRDGHLAHAVYTRLAPHLPGRPAHAYFPISRRLALGAGLSEPDGVERVLAAGPWHGTLGDLFLHRAGVSLPEPLAHTTVRLPEDRTTALASFGEPERTALTAHGDEEADALRAAVAAATGDAASVGVVDLGYSGTILRSLRSLIDQPVFGLFAASTAQVDDLGDTATCFTTNARIGHGDLIYDHAKVWEAVCSRVDDQAARYQCLADGTVGLDTTPGTRPADDVAATVQTVQRATLRFVDEHGSRFGERWLATPPDAPAVRQAFQAALGHGIPTPSEALPQLTIDDHFRNRGHIGVLED